MRHPQWQTDTPVDDFAAEGSLGDSLKDVQDMSLRLSVDGEKSSLNGSLEYDAAELEKVAAAQGGPELQDQVKHILGKIRRPTPALHEPEGGKKQPEMMVNKYPALRRKRGLIVIALDCYDNEGHPDIKMLPIVHEIFKAVKLDPQAARYLGFALLTAMPVAETVEFLKSGKIQAIDFDALVCTSGSEVYYPGTWEEDDGKLCLDPDYASHIDYRWGCEGLKKTIWRLMNTQEGRGDKSQKSSSAIEEDTKSSNAHCISYLMNDPTKVKRVDELRQKLRMRGLRCHLMYCRNSTRLQAIPLLASRAQALRYFFVRWGLNVANMYVVLGETGDTDYEELISGTHKTLIMKGVVEKGSEELLRATGSYQREDIVPGESSLVTYTDCGVKADEISNALRQLSKSMSGM